MALFTDGTPASIDTLKGYETAILSVANIEGIDLETKLGLAAEEVGEAILEFLLMQGTRDPQNGVRRATGLSDVVATAQVRRWHAVHTLEIVYRDAFNNQLNDRYQAKFDEYQALSQQANASTFNVGIGLVFKPLPRALRPQLSSVAGALAANTYYVQAAWVAGSAEGSPSEATTIATPPGSQLVVEAIQPPANATGWNVYAGPMDTMVTLQNPSPLAVGATFTLPLAGLVSGRAPGDGQAPDTYVTGGSLLMRG